MLWNIFYWVFGVGTCAYYSIETFTAVYTNPFLCYFFAPLFVIPISNCLTLLTRAGKDASRKNLAWMGSLQATAVGISAVLLIVLSPLVVLALIGMVLMIGRPTDSLMCLYYVLVAIGPFFASFALYRRMKRLLPSGEKMPGFGRATGLAIVLSLVLLALFPASLTRICQQAASEPSATPRALLLLRALGDENTLLKSCYDENWTSLPWYFSMLHFAMSSDYSEDDRFQQAREIFYRVKGKTFNSFARPRTEEYKDYYYVAEDGFYSYFDRSRDRDFAGDTVGGIVRGLSLTQSKITGWVDANEALSHLTWKMHFHNNDLRNTELRGQMLLPPHAVISGCALWIDGVKHQAVFAERESSRRAYEVSAIKGERPLLMSTAGAGRVLLQSSMGTWGKDAELEVNITTPLTLIDKSKAVLPLPVFSERNFAIDSSHDLTINSVTAAEANGQLTCKAGSSTTAPGYDLTGKFTNSEIVSSKGSIAFARDPAVTQVQCPGASAQTGPIQELFISERLSPTIPLTIVVDGSAGMSDSIGTICNTLKQAHIKDVSLVWASDQPATLASHVESGSSAWLQAVDRLRDSSCLGGQDNAAALAQAVKAQKTSGQIMNIVWLHATQPVAFAGTDLFSLMKNAKGSVKLYEYQVEPGPNVVIKSLDQLSSLEQTPRINGLANDLQSLLSRLAGDSDNFRIERGSAPVGSAARLSFHPDEVRQLNMSDLILANLSDDGKRADYGSMAEKLHLVTPLTSALVLETASMYKRYGVEKHEEMKGQPNSAISAKKAGTFSTMAGLISTKPEPPMSLLMAIALLIAMPVIRLIRRKKKFA